ncbi:MAG: T9SS type A sorting domain-containing protein [Bacteroidota bacterium]
MPLSSGLLNLQESFKDDLQIDQVVLFDLSGEQIQINNMLSISRSHYQLDLPEHLQNGTYIVTITPENQAYRGKMIILRP